MWFGHVRYFSLILRGHLVLTTCFYSSATALLRAGIETHVFESAPKFDEVGAGVGLGESAMFTVWMLVQPPSRT